MLKDVLNTALMSVIVYILIIAALRLIGRKGLSQLSNVDFVLILLLSRALSNDAGLPGAITMIFSLAIVGYITDKLIFKSKKFRETLQGRPVIFVENGKVIMKNLKAENFSLDELNESIRKKDVESIKDVKWAILEVDGTVSIIPKEKQ